MLLESIIQGDASNSFDFLESLEIIGDQNDMSSKFIDGSISFDQYKNYLSKGKFDVDDFEQDLDDIKDKDWGMAEESTSDEDYQPIERESRQKRIYSKLPKHLQGLMGSANLCWANGHTTKAKEICNEIMKQEPKAHEPYALLGLIHEESGDLPKSYQYTLLAAHLDPSDDPERWVKLAKSCDIEDNSRDAIKFYRKAITAFRRKSKSNFHFRLEVIKYSKVIATIYEDNGELKRAASEYQGILNYMERITADKNISTHDFTGEKIEIVTKLANIHFANGDMEAAYVQMKIIFDQFDLLSFDIGVVNLYIDLLLNTNRYLVILRILSDLLGTDLIAPSLSISKTLRDQSEREGSYNFDGIPENVPIDILAKLAVTLYRLQQFTPPVIGKIVNKGEDGGSLERTRYHYFRNSSYNVLLSIINRLILGTDPNLNGDLYLDIADALKIEGTSQQQLQYFELSNNYDQDLPTSSNYNGAASGATVTTLNNTVDPSDRWLRKFAHIALQFYSKLLGIIGRVEDLKEFRPLSLSSLDEAHLVADPEKDKDDELATAIPTNYSSIPGIWFSYAETLELLADYSGAFKAYQKVLELAPYHHISQFKLESLAAAGAQRENTQQHPPEETTTFEGFSPTTSTTTANDATSHALSQEKRGPSLLKNYSGGVEDEDIFPIKPDKDIVIEYLAFESGGTTESSSTTDDILLSSCLEECLKNLASILQHESSLAVGVDELSAVPSIPTLTNELILSRFLSLGMSMFFTLAVDVVIHGGSSKYAAHRGLIVDTIHVTSVLLCNSSSTADRIKANLIPLISKLTHLDIRSFGGGDKIYNTVPFSCGSGPLDYSGKEETGAGMATFRERKFYQEHVRDFQRIYDNLVIALEKDRQKRYRERGIDSPRCNIIDRSFNNLLFLNICALGATYLLTKTGTNQRRLKQFKYKIISLLILSRRWNTLFKFARNMFFLYFRAKTDRNSPRYLIQCCKKGQPLNVNTVNSFTYLMNLFFFSCRNHNECQNLLFSSAPSFTNAWEKWESSNLKLKSLPIELCSGSFYSPKNRSVIKIYLKFLTTNIRYLESQPFLDTDTSAPSSRDNRLYFTFVYSYLVLALSTGSYGAVITEAKNILRLLYPPAPSPPPPISPQSLLFEAWIQNNSHLKSQLFLILGVSLLQLCSQPFFSMVGLKLPASAKTLINKSFNNLSYTKFPLNFLPLTNAFTCFSRYLKYRGPCQESYYNVGRAYHQVDLLTLALHYYEKALAMGPPTLTHAPVLNGDQELPPSYFDLTFEIVLNMRNIYIASGSYEMASFLTHKYLTI